MADDPTLGEISRRLDRIEQQLSGLAANSVSPALYARDRDEITKDIADLRRDLDQERKDRREAVKDVYTRMDKAGTNWRQSLFSGVLPTLFLAITLAVTVLLALRGSGK